MLRPIFSAMKKTFAAGLAAAALFAAPLSAEERGLALGYNVYIGGINTIEIDFNSLIAPERYALDMKLRAGNFLRLFFSAQMTAFSQGRFAAGRPVPVKAGTDSVWNGNKRRIRLNYGRPGEAPRAETVPPVKEEARTPVTPEMKRGTHDLTGAVLQILNTVGQSDKCDASARVFDGRRAYVIHLKQGKKVKIRRTGYSVYAGEALKCRLVMERLGGYRTDLDYADKPTNDRVYVWLGTPFKGAPPVPVRMEFETRFGWLIAHLTKASLDRSGETIRLTRAD